MPYLLIEDGFADNTKILGLSDKAFRLHINALIYCARNLTDGAISEIALRLSALNSQIARPNAVVKDLVNAGLWHVDKSGWQIHDYLEYNPSRAEMEKKRQLTRERKRRHDRKSNASGNAASNASGNASQDPLRGSLKRPPPEQQPSGAATLGKTLARAQAFADTIGPEYPNAQALHEELLSRFPSLSAHDLDTLKLPNFPAAPAQTGATGA